MGDPVFPQSGILPFPRIRLLVLEMMTPLELNYMCYLFFRKSTIQVSSPHVYTLLYGMEYWRRTGGEINVVLCLKNAGQLRAFGGKNPFASLSKRRPCSGGIAYLKETGQMLRWPSRSSLTSLLECWEILDI